MEKVIKGTFELDKNIINWEEYEDKHRKAFEEILDWANHFNIRIVIWTSDDNSCLFKYEIVGETASFCKGLLSELRSMLKQEWKKTTSIWQCSGDILG